MIYAVGVNHKTAPVELREQLHLSTEEALVLLRASKDVLKEALVVSTCNRTELYGIPHDESVGGQEMVTLLRSLRPDTVLQDGQFFRTFTCGAVSHLLRVASSLDSQILGDVQILGQVKAAFDQAIEAGTAGTVFRQLFKSALHTGKRVRTETGLGIGAVSISFAAVELARRIFSDLHRKSALLVGAGETGELAARHLSSKGVERITITNRTAERAEALARDLGARVAPWDRLAEELREVDIVITATSAPEPILTADLVKRAMQGRHNRPLFIIDIAVPRDTEPAVGQLGNVFLHDLDSLQVIVDQNLDKRRQEIPRAELIVTEETVNFFVWYNSLAVIPTIQQIREKFEQVRLTEFDRFRNKLKDEDMALVDQLTKRIVNKLLHPTMVSLRDAVQDESSLSQRVALLRTLFDLSDTTEEDLP